MKKTKKKCRTPKQRLQNTNGKNSEAIGKQSYE